MRSASLFANPFPSTVFVCMCARSTADLLDRICGDKYDTIVYNYAGFSDSPCSSEPAGSAWRRQGNENKSTAGPTATVGSSTFDESTRLSLDDGDSDKDGDSPQVRVNPLE